MITASKGIKDKAPATPKSDKTLNPHEEHPATTMPKTVLPPTAKPSFTWAAFKLLRVFKISKIFNPTNIEVITRR